MSTTSQKPEKTRGRPKARSFPPGRIKISEALKLLLKEKEFSAITTAEIARTSGVNEALIYKYFGNKRGLLHQVLGDYVEENIKQLKLGMGGVTGALNKLRKLIWSHLQMYETQRVFARILLLEVRNYPGYFESESYQRVRKYSEFVKEIIEEGIKNGEIRDDIPAWSLRQIILGGIEHLTLPSVIFGREFSVDEMTEDLCNVIFEGIAKHD